MSVEYCEHSTHVVILLHNCKLINQCHKMHANIAFKGLMQTNERALSLGDLES